MNKHAAFGKIIVKNKCGLIAETQEEVIKILYYLIRNKGEVIKNAELSKTFY